MEKLINFPKILDKRGNLTFIENGKQIPFDITRVFWTYDVPGGEQRGGHAYHTLLEVVIAISGSFDVVVTDGRGQERRYQLNRSYNGLYLPSLTWRHLENFSTNALAFHLSSGSFSENEYIRDYEQYCSLAVK